MRQIKPISPANRLGQTGIPASSCPCPCSPPSSSPQGAPSLPFPPSLPTSQNPSGHRPTPDQNETASKRQSKTLKTLKTHQEKLVQKKTNKKYRGRTEEPKLRPRNLQIWSQRGKGRNGRPDQNRRRRNPNRFERKTLDPKHIKRGRERGSARGKFTSSSSSRFLASRGRSERGVLYTRSLERIGRRGRKNYPN